MPIEFKYNKNLKYLYITTSGNPTIEEAEQGMYEICNSQTMPANVNSLLDMRELSFSHIDIDYIKRFIVIRKKFNNDRGKAKVALLSNSAIAAPLIKLFTILSSDLRQKLHVFKTVQEAELWLCEDMLKG